MGDAPGAMKNMADDIEWVNPVDSSVSGTKRGKQELGDYWPACREEDGGDSEPLSRRRKTQTWC